MRDDLKVIRLKEKPNFTGFKIPVLYPCHYIPEKLIAFSKMKNEMNKNSFVHFYEIDEKILPFARNRGNYISNINQFQGAIGCDYSMYRNMPIFIQEYQTLLNHELMFYMQKLGISVIPNVRYGDECSYSFCFEGIPKNSILSIGTHGCIKTEDDINCHIKGIQETIRKLKPEALIFYGAVHEEIEALLYCKKVFYRKFDSDTSSYYKSVFEKNNPFLEGFEFGGE